MARIKCDMDLELGIVPRGAEFFWRENFTFPSADVHSEILANGKLKISSFANLNMRKKMYFRVHRLGLELPSLSA